MAGLEELVGQRISLLGDERKEKLDNYLERIRKAHTPTYLHCLRVGIKSQDAAKLFGCNTEEMLIAGLLHDIGKIYIPTEILDQHDEFSEEQYRKIESHPADGYCIVEKDFPFAAEILLRHHKYCKRSYPKKLPEPVNPRGFNLQAIAGYARILSVIDFYDAMTTRADNYKFSEENPIKRIACARPGMEGVIKRLFEAKILA